jgi:hypothetical protein
VGRRAGILGEGPSSYLASEGLFLQSLRRRLGRVPLLFHPEYGEQFFMGDSVENGVICGTVVVNRVSDGKIWAPWGERGNIWGGMEGAADGCDVHDLS